MSPYERGLAWNIKGYTLFRTLNKRAYLPLIAVYAVSVAGLDLGQFGLVASLTALTSLVLEIPSGYLSDRIGHKKSLILGCFIMALSPLAYVIWPNFTGVLLGSAGYFGGYAFISGTLDAFLHESLLELDRGKEYGRVVGRAQAVSLLGNVVLVSLVPLLYPLDHRLPFLVGSLLMTASFCLSFFLTTPRRSKREVAELESVSFMNLMRSLHVSRAHLLFLFLGVTGAASDKVPEFREIYLQVQGMPVIYFGFLLAISSLIAALASFNIHKLEFLPERAYYGLSAAVLVSLTILAGIGGLWLGAACMILLVVYNRNEITLTQSYLLRRCPTRELKATYLSTLAFAKALNGLWIPLALGYLASAYGIRAGYGYFGVILFVLTGIVLLGYSRQKSMRKASLSFD